jgi:uncharacterized membrane protein
VLTTKIMSRIACGIKASGSPANLTRVIEKARIEAFSDGVIAIAITLLVLDLHVPLPTPHHTLADQLGTQWPSYAGYVVSFLTIGVIWINHHAMLRRVKAVTHPILLLNLLLLLTIGVLPFTTALMAAYLRGSSGENLAAVIYGGSFMAMSLSFFAMQRQILSSGPQMLADHLTPEIRAAVIRRNAVGLLPYAVATVGGILSPYFTLAICGVVAVFYALPGTTADQAPTSR